MMHVLYRHRFCAAIIAASLCAAFALATSSAPAMAQHRGGASVGHGTFSNPAGAHGRLGHTNDPHFDRRRPAVFPASATVFTDPYASYSGWNNGTGYTPTCGDATTPCPSNFGPRWDEDNHSSATNRGAYVTAQPSAKIIEVPSREDSEHERAWLQRCEPRIMFDESGVPHYVYNGKRGCPSGQWTD
jgi:hypothetical protein